MKPCRNCILADKYKNVYVHSGIFCKYFERYVLNPVENCNHFISENIKCEICEERTAKWLTISRSEDGDRQKFLLCPRCSSKLNKEYPETIVKEMWLDKINAKALYKILKDKCLEDKDMKSKKEAVEKLSKTEKEVYNLLKSLKHHMILVRSLNRSYTGALGNLIRYNLGEMKTTEFGDKKRKVFHLTCVDQDE